MVAVVYRMIAAVLYSNRPLVRVMAEEVPRCGVALRGAVRVALGYVGAGYVEHLAHLRSETFRRNPPDVGIIASFDSLGGPTCDVRGRRLPDPQRQRHPDPGARDAGEHDLLLTSRSRPARHFLSSVAANATP